MDSWIQDLKDCRKNKKESLLRRIATLEMQLNSTVGRAESSTEHVRPEPASATAGCDGPAPTAKEDSPEKREGPPETVSGSGLGILP